MKTTNNKLSFISILILLASLLYGCADAPVSDTPSEGSDATLEAGEDMGWEYIDSFIFFGESTTYHLKSRGVLSAGVDTTQVWAPKSGTATLDSTITSVRIVYPKTGEELTVPEAARRERPERMLLTFGLNGAVANIKRGEEYFKGCYRSLINAILEASPYTEIVMQSCFPVAKNMDMTNYTVDVDTLNEYIRTLNLWSMSLSEEMGFGYLNSYEIMIDTEGYLKDEYQAGDGYHLTREAYTDLLEYIRTHPKEKQ